MKPNLKKALIISTVALLLIALVGGGWRYLGTKTFVRTTLSGLTLGSLFFMVAAGLTLIFFFFYMLNFAHGAMFMLGGYIGWQTYTNPTFIFGLAPSFFAFATGVLILPAIKSYLINLTIGEKLQKAIPRIAYVLAALLALIAFLKLNILDLADTAMVAITTTATSNPLMELSAQEPLSVYWFRPLLLLISGLLIAVALAKPGDKTEFAPKENILPKLILPVFMLVATIIFVFVRESAPQAILLMDGTWRFFLSLLLAIGFGFIFGAVIEITLIRPLYVRSFFIVLLTLGLSFVIREVVQLLWDPLAYQMVRPPLFNQPGKAANLWDWFQNHNSTLDIFGVTFPSYRLFIIALGILMFLFITILMNKSRLGMIIRAGVQDPEMVEALGINVRQVFTFVFAIGVALAALGGIGAAPFIPIQPLMGDQFQMQGFITVVIGGMGSYIGAFIGAFILGMARAFGDYFALKFSLSPAIAEASTVIIMIIVLTIRPSGLFGKKE